MTNNIDIPIIKTLNRITGVICKIAKNDCPYATMVSIKPIPIPKDIQLIGYKVNVKTEDKSLMELIAILNSSNKYDRDFTPAIKFLVSIRNNVVQYCNQFHKRLTLGFYIRTDFVSYSS